VGACPCKRTATWAPPLSHIDLGGVKKKFMIWLSCPHYEHGGTVAAETTKTARGAVYQVKVFDKMMDILDLFTLQRRELSLREIVETTGLNRPTVTRLVVNLERRGLLQPAPAPGRYRLGQRLFQLGSIVRASFSVVEGRRPRCRCSSSNRAQPSSSRYGMVSIP